ncbi:MAG: Adenosyl-chloride synthase [Promethearchaeota archaeon]|nr:MAG: Adenosyl-chloride synthase [Candidatus Lokiarchaeota archaeon]
MEHYINSENSKSSIVALLTDFGWKGAHYVASMKAVILKINPRINIIDLSHSVSPYSLIEASYLLKAAYPYFPKGTIFVSVIDPGVGTQRRIVVIKSSDDYFFVGPDNGIFPNALEENIELCYAVEDDFYFHKPVSHTFHGRDIMAPVGAYITTNVPLEKFGSVINPEDLTRIPIINEVNTKERRIKCTIQYVDDFGNITTTISVKKNDELTYHKSQGNIKLQKHQEVTIFVNDRSYRAKYVSHFAEVNPKSLLLMRGSTGFLEMSLNQGNAAEKLEISSGKIIEIQLSE